MGPNAKELFRLVEDFVDVIGFRMKDLRDAYQVTDNLGKPRPRTVDPTPATPLPCSPGPGLAASLCSSVCTRVHGQWPDPTRRVNLRGGSVRSGA